MIRDLLTGQGSMTSVFDVEGRIEESDAENGPNGRIQTAHSTLFERAASGTALTELWSNGLNVENPTGTLVTMIYRLGRSVAFT